MDKINHCINHNRFIPIDKDELSALELIGKIVNKTNDVVVNLNDKTDLTGDHKGSWQGVEDVAKADPGISGSVIKNRTDITILDNQLKDLYNIKRFPRLSGETDDTNRINRCLLENNAVFLSYQVSPYIIVGEGIKVKTNQLIIGCGNNLTKLLYKGTKNCISFIGIKNDWNWDNACKNLVIKDINIEGENKSGNGIYLDKVYRSSLINVKTNKLNVGVYIASGWTNNYERLESTYCTIGIKIGDSSYNTGATSTSYINNATNIINSRFEYNDINLDIGDKDFNGTQNCSNINIERNTIQFGNVIDIRLNNSTNVNIINNYFEVFNQNSECIIQIGYINQELQEGVSHSNKYLICDNIKIKGNIFVGDNNVGNLQCFKFKNYENITVQDNTFMSWINSPLNTPPFQYKKLMTCDDKYRVKWNDNSYNNSTRNIEGLWYGENVVLNGDLKNGWFNGGNTSEEKVTITVHNGIVFLDGIIASDTFSDGQVMFYLGDNNKPKKLMRFEVRSRQVGLYPAMFYTVTINIDGSVKISSETTGNEKCLLSLSGIRFNIL